MFMPIFDQKDRETISKARQLGGKGPRVYLENNELLRLCAIVAIDLDQPNLVSSITNSEDIPRDYYGISLEWFSKPVSRSVDLVETFLLLKHNIRDFETYFANLCEIHKHRVKFKLILEKQKLPEVEPIVPRCLLEYKLIPSETLASWLVWRKWLYNIDNRSAQETGYLFEPILASAIGGVPFSATKSPVKRLNDSRKGRQVDCIYDKLAYEFKMRVTSAASGQGRIKEELDFASDCHSSGYTPILLVLDPSSSNRLDELVAEYSKYGGSTFTGNDAWNHIEEKAGPVMGKFVKKYVRVPLKEVDSSYKSLSPIRLVNTETEIIVQIGDQSFSIARTSAKEDYGENEDTDESDPTDE